jgi:predicted MFS family arabinose efflux permease
VLILNFTQNGAIAVASWCLLQASTGFYWPPLQAWFTQGLSEEALNRDISWFNRCWMSGSLLGPFLGGLLYHHNQSWTFGAALICFSLVLFSQIFLALRSGNSEAEETPAPRDAAAGRNPNTPEPLRRTITLFKIRGWIGALCANFFYGIMANVIPLFIRDTLGYSEYIASLLLLFRGAAAIVAFTWYARYTFWHFNRRWFLILQGSIILCSILLFTAGAHVLIYLGIAFLYGFVYAGCYNNSIFHSGADKKNTGRNMALHEMFLSVGSAMGALGGGFCFQYIGMAGTLLVLALIQAAGFLALVLIDRQT